jgi:hypothetical protein
MRKPAQEPKNEAIVTSAFERDQTHITVLWEVNNWDSQATERQLMPHMRDVKKTLDAVQTNFFYIF